MTTSVLRIKYDVAGASMADLVATYNRLAAKPVKRFENRTVAERRVAELLPATAPKPDKPEEPQNPYKPGTMAHRLWFSAREKPPIEPRPKLQKRQRAEGEKRTRRARVDAVQLSEKPGTTKVQANSLRGQILAWLQKQPEWRATVEKMESKSGLNMPCRGHIQKLLEGGHISVVEAA